MRPLASIYSHRVPEFMETQVGFNPIQKRNSNPKKKVQTRLSVDPGHGRPAWSTVPNRERALVSRSTWPVDRSFLCTPVHTGRPGRSTRLLHRSTGSTSGLLHAPFLATLSSDLCATSFHLLYLLSPIILHLGEDFSNLSRSPTNSSLSPGEIDTRSRRNRHTISACALRTKSTHDLGLESVAQLSTGMHHTCPPYTSL